MLHFVEHYEHLLGYYNVVTESDKCRGILKYCSQKIEDFIIACPNYITPDWNALRADILKYYDAERMETRITPSEFFTYLNGQMKKSITTLIQWKRYNRNYLSYGGFLKRKGQINNDEYEGYFWYGIPENLRDTFDAKLQAKNPTYDTSDPWPITQVQEVADAYFNRNKFSEKLLHLPSLGVRRKYEEEEEEDDFYHYDSEEDDEDDDDDEDDYHYQLKKKTPKKKDKDLKKSKSKPKSFRGPPPIKVLKEESSRKIIPPPEDGKIEQIIHQLNTMSLDDPKYGSLYYQAIKSDTQGIVAQCIQRRPKQMETPRSRPSREYPPHQNQPPVNPI